MSLLTQLSEQLGSALRGLLITGRNGDLIPAVLKQLLYPGTKPAYYTEEEWPSHSHLLKDYSKGVGDLREKRLGYCYNFTQDDNTVNFGNILNPSTNSYTIAIRCKFDSFDTGFIFAKTTGETSSTVGFNIATDNESGVFLRVSDGTNRAGVSTSSLVTGQWYSIIMVIDRSSDLVVGYVDGSSEGIIAGGGGPTTNNLANTGSLSSGTALTIGDLNSFRTAFKGSVYDARIWDGKALTANEALHYHSFGVNGDDPGAPSLWCPLQEESFTTAYDISGNANHGTIVNAVTSGVGSIHQPDAGVVKSYPNDEGYSQGFEFDGTGTGYDTGVTSVNTNDRSWSGYIRLRDLPERAGLIANRNTSSLGFQLVVDTDRGVQYDHVGGEGFSSAPGIILNDVTYFIELSKVGNHVEVRVDNVVVIDETITDGNNTVGNIFVGYIPFGTTNVNGYIWNVTYIENGVQVLAPEDAPTLIPAATPTTDALGGTLTHTGRVPQYGLAKHVGWQGDGSSVYVDLGEPIIPATDDFTLVIDGFKYTVEGAITQDILSQRTNFGEQNGRLNISADLLTTNDFRMFLNPATGIDIADAFVLNNTYKITIERSGGRITATLLNKTTAESRSGSMTGVTSVRQTNTVLLARSSDVQSEYSEDSIGTVSITTGGVTTTYSPIEGTRNVAVTKSDGTSSIIYNAVKNGVDANLYSEGGGSWRLPHIENGARWASQNLIPWSEDLTQWSTVGTTSLESNVALSPDNTMSADRVNNLNDAAGQRIRTNVVSITNATLTGSIWVKGEGVDIGKPITLNILRDGGTSVSEVVSTTLTDEWSRISVTMTQAADNTGARMAIVRTTDGANSALLWGGQINEGSTPLPYEKTGANSWSASALIPAAPGASVAANGNALNILANKAPRGLLTDRTGAVIAPLDYQMGTDAYTDEAFDDTTSENTVDKRRTDTNYSDRYGAATTDISGESYFDA